MTALKPPPLDAVYEARFDERARRGKMAVWAEIERLPQAVRRADRPVLDIGCDAGYFIRHVAATERWATDIRDVQDLLPDGVRFVRATGCRWRTSCRPATSGPSS